MANSTQRLPSLRILVGLSAVTTILMAVISPIAMARHFRFEYTISPEMEVARYVVSFARDYLDSKALAAKLSIAAELIRAEIATKTRRCRVFADISKRQLAFLLYVNYPSPATSEKEYCNRVFNELVAKIEPTHELVRAAAARVSAYLASKEPKVGEFTREQLYGIFAILLRSLYSPDSDGLAFAHLAPGDVISLDPDQFLSWLAELRRDDRLHLEIDQGPPQSSRESRAPAPVIATRIRPGRYEVEGLGAVDAVVALDITPTDRHSLLQNEGYKRICQADNSTTKHNYGCWIGDAEGAGRWLLFYVLSTSSGDSDEARMHAEQVATDWSLSTIAAVPAGAERKIYVFLNKSLRK